MQSHDEARQTPVSSPGVTGMSEIPRVVRMGHTSHLLVDGAPYLAVGGELHNSSPSSPAYMAPIWDRLQRNGVPSVIGAASWQLVEPEEGKYDFTAVDDQIEQARARGMRLILIWFGSYKNADSAYSPTWVRRDEQRFPRAERDPERLLSGRFSIDGPVLSVFSEDLLRADARAFAVFMRHLREVDPQHTVIAVQVQNEVGLLGDSRDRSPLAETAWAAPVPAELLSGLSARGDRLHSWVRDLWARHGSRPEGTWAEVFGPGRDAEEVFMSWAFSRFVGQVAEAGTSEYPLPVYTNAWLGPQPNAKEPGQYPSGGPVARMIDVWQIGAPGLAFLSPDIYIEDFAGTLTDYSVAGNPVFVPEARPDAGLLFVTIGRFGGIGFHPFGIEDIPDGHDLFDAYQVIQGMQGVITQAQAQAGGAIHGFRLESGQEERVSLGGYDISISGPLDTRGMFGEGTGSAATSLTGYGLLIQAAPDEFIVVARGASFQFTRGDTIVELDTLTEGAYLDGQWMAGRILNGDERYYMFPKGKLRTVRIELLRRSGRAVESSTESTAKGGSTMVVA
jgi:hypothetical protein